jgi:hypothetical protein
MCDILQTMAKSTIAPFATRLIHASAAEATESLRSAR